MCVCVRCPLSLLTLGVGGVGGGGFRWVSAGAKGAPKFFFFQSASVAFISASECGSHRMANGCVSVRG